MLKKEDNELITRVGPGTPMGNLMREYWVPAMLSSELPQGDCDPVRVKLLGEQLIGFRDSNGKVGLLANNCPHRGASLFFGRNEEAGLRCVYNGWKFDTTHVGFLHYGGLNPDDQPKGTFSEYQLRQKPAHFEVIDTPGGVAYGARRPGPPGEYYWRTAQFCMPCV